MVMMVQGGSPNKRRFFPIKTDSLLDNTAVHFDIYALLDKDVPSAAVEDFLLYAKAPYTWTLRELTDLTRVGIHELFVEEKHRNNYERYVKINQDVPKIDPELEPRFRLVKVHDVGRHLIECCFLTEINAPLIEKIETVAGQVVDCLMEDPRSVLQIQTLAEHDLYTYVHSVGVGTLTAAIALEMGETNRDELKLLALGGLLHDVGKKSVPLGVLNKAGPLEPEEWEQMKAHPLSGLTLLKDIVQKPLVVDIVGLHHEKLDGSGYPNGLTKEAIPLHVQIATVADIFNALTTTRCYHRKRTRFEALMFMKHHMRGKISQDVFKALVGCMVSDAERTSAEG